uniref:Ig-like domain-containing protein n=1 Tax=Zonotrichia albicollis TaxID=44394 RepID=A0A8D2M2P2_ZONAL
SSPWRHPAWGCWQQGGWGSDSSSLKEQQLSWASQNHIPTAAFLISTPYSLCVCPEGQNVTLSCRVSGALAERHDLLYKTWYFSSTGDQSCSDKRHVRNVTDRELHHDLARHHNASQKPSSPGRPSGHRGVELLLDHHGAFHIVVANVTLQDSGNYCCYAVEVSREGHGKPHTLQVAHGFVELQVQRGKVDGRAHLCSCVADITAAALATGACIVGILCLPLILLLIYKQRQAASSRRTCQGPLFPPGLAGVCSNGTRSHGCGVRCPKHRARPGFSWSSPGKDLNPLFSTQNQSLLTSWNDIPSAASWTNTPALPFPDPVPDSPNSLKA